MNTLHNSKLIHYLQTLQKSELGRFAKFLHSPYFNHSENITRLYEYLRKQWPDFEEDKLGREKVFKKVFRSPDYDYKTLENHQTRLTALLQKFLVLEEIELRQNDKELLQLKMMYSRGLDGYFEGEVRKIKGNLEKTGVRNAEYHLSQYKTSDWLLFHPRLETSKRQAAMHENLAYNLDSFYLLNGLKIIGEQLMAKRDLNATIKVNFQEEIEKMAAHAVFEEEHLLQMYRLNLELFYEPSYATYSTLKDMLLKHLSAMSFRDKETLFSYLLAHTGHLGLSQSQFWREYFELYRIGFQENILLSNGKILPSHFLNAVVLAAELGELEWLSKFITQEAKHLPQEEQEKCIFLGKANYAFAAKNFEECVQVLYQVESFKNDPYFALRVFPLELRANYELAAKFKGDDFLLNWKRYKRYLNDNETISQNRREANLNFLSISKKLYKAIFKKIDKLKLEQEIQALTPMIAKAWCLEKL